MPGCGALALRPPTPPVVGGVARRCPPPRPTVAGGLGIRDYETNTYVIIIFL